LQAWAAWPEHANINDQISGLPDWMVNLTTAGNITAALAVVDLVGRAAHMRNA